jgi:hypothetical protein
MTASLLLLLACVGFDTSSGKPDGVAGEDSGATLGSLSLDASAFDFGTVAVGDSVDKTLTLTNTGDTALDVDLSIEGSGFGTSSGSVAVDDTEVVTLTFAPDATGDFTGTLQVQVVDGDSLDVPLSGSGAADGDTDEDSGDPDGPAPEILVSPSHYSFGRVDVDDTVTTSFTVSNQGDDDLLIREVSTSDRAFTTGGTLSPPQVLSPGSNKLLEVSFTPTAETTYTGTIVVSSDDPNTPDLEIAVDGAGVDLCDVCAPIIDVDTGSSPYAITDFFYSSFTGTDTRTLTVQNIGDMDLEVTDVYVKNDTLASCGTFTVGGWTSAKTLAPYATTSFTLAYRATGSCVEVAQSAFDMNVLHILSNDPTQDDWVVELSGLAL